MTNVTLLVEYVFLADGYFCYKVARHLSCLKLIWLYMILKQNTFLL